MAQFKGEGTASQAAGTVAIGPIKVDAGKCDVTLVAKTNSGTITTPTDPKLQYSPIDDGDVWLDVGSGAVTVSSTASTESGVTVQDIVCRRIQVVTEGAFAAGDADVYLHGVEK